MYMYTSTIHRNIRDFHLNSSWKMLVKRGNFHFYRLHRGVILNLSVLPLSQCNGFKQKYKAHNYLRYQRKIASNHQRNCRSKRRRQDVNIYLNNNKDIDSSFK